MDLRLDDTGFKGYKLYQDPETFCYGVDAVLLADYAEIRKGENVLDLGCGNGAVPIVMLGKFDPACVTGIEVQPRMAELAEKTARYNNLQDKFNVITGDVLDIKQLVSAAQFDAVTCNPPYTESGRGPGAAAGASFIARHETTAALSDFIAAAAYALKPGGRFVMVHRPSRLADIICGCRDAGLEPKKMRLVAPREGCAANIVLISCVKGGGKQLTVDPQLVVRSEDGGYTQEINRIYERI